MCDYIFVPGTGPVSREKNCSALTTWHTGIDAGRWEITFRPSRIYVNYGESQVKRSSTKGGVVYSPFA